MPQLCFFFEAMENWKRVPTTESEESGYVYRFNPYGNDYAVDGDGVYLVPVCFPAHATSPPAVFVKKLTVYFDPETRQYKVGFRD